MPEQRRLLNLSKSRSYATKSERLVSSGKFVLVVRPVLVVEDADYNSVSLTLGQHRLSLLRPVLLEHRLVSAATLMTYRNGRLARGCGLATVCQRTGTAKGVMFVTIEDETGNVNFIIWPPLQE